MGATVEKEVEEPYYLLDGKTDPKHACERLTQFIRRCEKFPVIGLDAEWTQSYPSQKTDAKLTSVDIPQTHLLGASREPKKIRNPVAILQLANRDGPALLIRLRQIDPLKDTDLDWQTFFVQLKDLLSSTQILKVGVAIQVDTSYLFYDYGLYTVNCLDLQHVARHYNFPKSGLAYLSKRLCNVDLPKSYAHWVDWDGPNLSARSLEYATNDAKLGVLIFEKFMEQSIQETKNDPKPVKNCTDYINLWRFKIDVLYRHIHRPLPPKDSNGKREGNDVPKNQAGSATLLQGCPQASVGVLQHRTDKGKDHKRNAKTSFFLLIIVAGLTVSLALSVVFQLFQRKW